MEERIEGEREREAFVVVEDAIEAPAPLSPPTDERCKRSLLLLLLLLLILFLHRDSPPLSPSWGPGVAGGRGRGGAWVPAGGGAGARRGGGGGGGGGWGGGEPGGAAPAGV